MRVSVIEELRSQVRLSLMAAKDDSHKMQMQRGGIVSLPSGDCVCASMGRYPPHRRGMPGHGGMKLNSIRNKTCLAFYGLCILGRGP